MRLRERHLLKGVKFPRGWGVYFDLAKRDQIHEAMRKISGELSVTDIENSIYRILLTIAELMYRDPAEHGLTICSFLICAACPVGRYMTHAGLCAAQIDDTAFREQIVRRLLGRYDLLRSRAIEIGLSVRGTFRLEV